MNLVTRTALTLASVGALLATGLPQASPASAATTDQPHPVSTEVTQSHEDVVRYWTPQRMRAAKSGNRLAAKAIRRHQAAPGVGHRAPTRGEEFSVAPSPPSGQRSARSETPIKNIGKVFFTLDGDDYQCSGNTVAGGNRDTVATAGHCVNAGPGPNVKNWQFVPGYTPAGGAPMGKWTARRLVSTSQWSQQGDITFDTGFAVTAGLNGKHINEVTGGSGVTFNAARNQSYTLYGYPVLPPFNGNTLEKCAGKAKNDPTGQTKSQGVVCNLTEGASGGPWFLGSGSAGNQNSVNSFGYDFDPTVMYGPYWGNELKAAYDQAIRF